MPHHALSTAIARASRSIGFPSEVELAEGGLLSQFIQTKDETAFAELVRRFGPMVLGVCRRITGDRHHAEDAFQAAFIVLARRASDVRPREGLRVWLYGVAVRTARRARSMSIQLRAHELGVPSLPDRPAEPEEPLDSDRLRILDEEVCALPDHLRVAVVLCELEGQSRKDVAGKIGIPEGTLSSRLAAARKRLAERLSQRGIALSTVAFTTSLGQIASAQPSVALITKAALAATRDFIPASVAALSEGVLRIMFLNKLKTTIPLALMAAGLLVCATVVAVRPSTPPLLIAATHTDQPAAKDDAKPQPKGPNKLLFYRAGQLTLIDPDGKNELKVGEDRGKLHTEFARLSPDGKKLAVVIQTYKGDTPEDERKLYVRDLAELRPGKGIDLDVSCQLFAWSPDGSYIVASDHPYLAKGDRLTANHTLVNVKTKEKKSLKLPDDHIITDWTPDGKYLLTHCFGQPSGIFLMNMDGTEHKALVENAGFGRVSPDGTRVLYRTFLSPKKQEDRQDVNVLNIASGNITKVAELPLSSYMGSCCWSPDGKRIAYTWIDLHDEFWSKIEPHLVVCDLDGKNPKTIVSDQMQLNSFQWNSTYNQVDWR